MTTATTKASPIPCPAGCEDGRAYTEPKGFSRTVEVETCETCRGTGSAICEALGCAKAATLCGEDGEGLYCGTAHAYAEHNWPACAHCEGEPQDPPFAPFCSATCRDAHLTPRFAPALERFHARIYPGTTSERAGWLTDAAAAEG